MKTRLNRITVGGKCLAWLFAVLFAVGATGRAWAAVTKTAYTDASGFGKWAYSTVYSWTPTGGSLGTLSSLSMYAVDADGNTASTATSDWWKLFCSTQTAQYQTPGYIFYVPETTLASDASANINWGPFSLGGLYVKTAGVTLTSSVSDKTARLGGAGDKSTTYFVVGKSFAMKCSSYTLYGTVDLYVGDESNFNISGGITGTDGTATLDTDTAATLKMSGAGAISVSTLVASGATLDFASTELSRATGDNPSPFITGNLTVDSSTKYVFPAGLSAGTAYTLCTGTLNAPSTGVMTDIVVGTETKQNVVLTFSGNTVTYSEPTIYDATVDGETVTWGSSGAPSSYDNATISFTLAEGATAGVVTGRSGSGTTINAGSGVTVDVTDFTSPTLLGTGTFRYTRDYPTTVPANLAYEYVFSGDEASPTVISDVVTINNGGTLKSVGYTTLSGANEFMAGSVFEVVSGKATVSARAGTAATSYYGGLAGTIQVDANATFANTTTDALGSTSCLILYGTLDMGTSRWTIGNKVNNEIRLYEGSTITGSGDGTAALHFNRSNATSCRIDVYSGDIAITAPIKVGSSSGVTFWVNSGAQCTVSSTGDDSGSFSKDGSGTLRFSPPSLNHSGKVYINDGTVLLDNTGKTFPVEVRNGGTLSVKAGTETVNIGGSYRKNNVTLNATVKSGGRVTLATEGGNYIQGSVVFEAKPNTGDTTFNTADWRGTLQIAALSQQGSVPLASYGNANSKIILKGLGGGSTAWKDNYFGINGDVTVQAEVQIDGDVLFNNGWSGKNYGLRKVTGGEGATLTFGAWSDCTSCTYSIGELSNFAGTIVLTNASTHGSFTSYTFKLGNIVTEAVSYSTPLVKILTGQTTAGDNYAINISDLSSTTLNGAAATLVYDDSTAGSEGIYLAEATVTTGGVTTPYKTLETAFGIFYNALSSDATACMTVLNDSKTLTNGYGDYGIVLDNRTYRKAVASIDKAGYTTLEAAVSAAGTAGTSTIVLWANNTETITLADGGTLKIKKGSYTCNAPTPATSAYVVTESTADGTTTYTSVAKPSVTISGVEFEYLATYAGIKSVSADVATTAGDASGLTYTLKINGTAVKENVAASGGKVTFSDLTTTVTAGGSFTYEIVASDDAGTTTPTTTTAASTVGGWIDEKSGAYNATGTWSPSVESTATSVAISESGIFKPANPSVGETVTVTTEMTFTAPNTDASVDLTGAQAAVRVKDDNTYQVLNGGAWVDATGATPVTDRAVAVTFALDYGAGTYTVTVGSDALQYNDSSALALANAGGKAINEIAFAGNGSVVSINGGYVTTAIEVVVDAESDEIAVDSAWIAANMSDKTVTEAKGLLARDSETKLGNGYNWFANYALGLEPTKEDSKPVVTVTPNATGGFDVSVEGWGTIPDGVKVSVAMKAYSDADCKTAVEANDGAGTITKTGTTVGGEGITLATPTTGELNYYKAVITIGADK